MIDKFDELARGMAQSVTRRGALRTFGVGLAGIALAALGLANTAEAKPPCFKCNCRKPDYGCAGAPSICYSQCLGTCPAQCESF